MLKSFFCNFLYEAPLAQMNKLKPYYVKPAKTFFYWGWTIPKEHYEEIKSFFGLSRINKRSTHNIIINFKKKKYPAKINYTRIDNSRKYKSQKMYPERDVIRVQYDSEHSLIKELKKSFTYSFVTNYQKRRAKLSELIQFAHLEDNIFSIKPYITQETEYDDMFKEMIDRGLFSFMEKDNKKNKESVFLRYDDRWHEISELKEFQNRYNVIYLLHHSIDGHVYVGQAKDFKKRVVAGKGREGLSKDWDKFMCFELNPDFAYLLNDIETFAIRFMGSVMTNDVKIKSLVDTKIKLVNRHKRNK